jgi:hypothetical protein
MQTTAEQHCKIWQKETERIKCTRGHDAAAEEHGRWCFPNPVWTKTTRSGKIRTSTDLCPPITCATKDQTRSCRSRKCPLRFAGLREGGLRWGPAEPRRIDGYAYVWRVEGHDQGRWTSAYSNFAHTPWEGCLAKENTSELGLVERGNILTRIRNGNIYQL